LSIPITDFLRDEFGKPFIWGETDCLSTVARWVEIRRGINPVLATGIPLNADTIRQRLSERNLLEWARVVFRRAGLKRTTDPQIGDIGLVVHGATVATSIRARIGWIAHSETGFSMSNGRLLMAWQV
jgi:hypothetical protein